MQPFDNQGVIYSTWNIFIWISAK